MAYFLPPRAEIPESRHAAVGAWFLGPRAENFSYLERIFKTILERQRDARQNLFPKDEAFISAEMQGSELFQAQIALLESELSAITEELNQHSVPFWSPRYNAHMSMENSMPAVIGYLTGLLHNQNNVATEASPFTTVLENRVGQDLCKMLGYDITPTDVAHAWGHITCGGSVANLESIWAARNLKFYPLSLSLAISEGSLKFLDESGSESTPRFEIELCTGEKKPFMTCSPWELLNLKPSTVLDIPDRLANTYGVSQTALAAAMHDYLIQTTGKDYLEKKFRIERPAQFFVGTTKHYSWPKGAAIAGIGSGQIVDVPVDLRARMDSKILRKMLEQAVATKQALYAVIAIMGSTEQGAVDPLTDILALRTEFEKQGLSFVVHCDGAWGGYFASMVREQGSGGIPKGQSTYVPTLALSPYTEEQLRAYKDADSITIDPHKSGYCPYPAGGLCYRDGRMRYLNTWTSPVVFRAAEEANAESIGVYGVEGSKPGAAAVGAYLSHRVLGLHINGYGTLLGEAVFSCARLYCHWAAMKTEPVDAPHGAKARLIVRPLDMLPTEKDGASPSDIEKQRQFIRDRILNRDNAALEADQDAVNLLKQVGGDLMINAFACNFEINGKLNEDVVEANYLNAQIYQQLSVSDMSKDISNIPLLLTSTSLAQSAYQDCLTHFKERLGLKGDQDMYVLINVTMSPWPTTGNFLGSLAAKFQAVAEKEMQAAVLRNVAFPDLHGFIIQGTDQICGVHLPMFNMENHRYQLIITCDMPADVMKKYREHKAANPTQFFTFGNNQPMKLLDFIKDGASFDARLDEALPTETSEPLVASFTVSNVKILLQRSMHPRDLAPTYPDKMVVYAYGRGAELHLDHLLNVSPNIQLNSERIRIVESSAPRPAVDMIAMEGAWLRLTRVNEQALQPLLMKPTDAHTAFDHPGLPWTPRAAFAFAAFASERAALDPRAAPVIAGTLTLGPSVFADANMLNADPGAHPDDHASAGGALAVEYPNAGASVEMRNRYQSRVVRSFADSWTRAKGAAARERKEAHEEGAGPLPGWIDAWLDAGEKVAAAGKAGPRPVPMYGAGMR